MSTVTRSSMDESPPRYRPLPSPPLESHTTYRVEYSTKASATSPKRERPQAYPSAPLAADTTYVTHYGKSPRREPRPADTTTTATTQQPAVQTHEPAPAVEQPTPSAPHAAEPVAAASAPEPEPSIAERFPGVPKTSMEVLDPTPSAPKSVEATRHIDHAREGYSRSPINRRFVDSSRTGGFERTTYTAVHTGDQSGTQLQSGPLGFSRSPITGKSTDGSATDLGASTYIRHFSPTKERSVASPIRSPRAPPQAAALEQGEEPATSSTQRSATEYSSRNAADLPAAGRRYTRSRTDSPPEHPSRSQRVSSPRSTASPSSRYTTTHAQLFAAPDVKAQESVPAAGSHHQLKVPPHQRPSSPAAAKHSPSRHSLDSRTTYNRDFSPAPQRYDRTTVELAASAGGGTPRSIASSPRPAAHSEPITSPRVDPASLPVAGQPRLTDPRRVTNSPRRPFEGSTSYDATYSPKAQESSTVAAGSPSKRWDPAIPKPALPLRGNSTYTADFTEKSVVLSQSVSAAEAPTNRRINFNE